MNKYKYLIELRKRLSLLDSKEVDQIIGEYIDYIHQRQSLGLTEDEAVQAIGDVNVIAREILKSYKISDTYISLFVGKEKVIDEVNEFVKKVTDVSATVLSKLEESVTGFAKTVYDNTKKFSEERIKDVKNIFKKASEAKENKPTETVTEADYEIID